MFSQLGGGEAQLFIARLFTRVADDSMRSQCACSWYAWISWSTHKARMSSRISKKSPKPTARIVVQSIGPGWPPNWLPEPPCRTDSVSRVPRLQEPPQPPPERLLEPAHLQGRLSQRSPASPEATALGWVWAAQINFSIIWYTWVWRLSTISF
jgi:hypothetical protein